MNGTTKPELKPMMVEISNGGGSKGGRDDKGRLVLLQLFLRRLCARPMQLLATVCLLAMVYKMAGIGSDVRSSSNNGDVKGGGESKYDDVFALLEKNEGEIVVKKDVRNSKDDSNNVNNKGASGTDNTPKTEQGKEKGGEKKAAQTTNAVKHKDAKGEKGDQPASISTTNAPFPLPPLSSLLNKKGEIKSDVSWLLNLVILGFPKSGTTYLEHNLNTPNSYLIHSEQCKLASNKTDLLVPILYQEPPSKVEGLIRGIKCPRLLESEYALSNCAKYFPNANFIMSSRHPVLWFQSFYNYRSYKMYPEFDKMPSDLIGSCHRERENMPYVCVPDIDNCDKTLTYNVCTDRARFHHALSRLGKTPMKSKEELDLLDHHNMSIVPSKSKVFFIELAQISDQNETRAKIFRDDLKSFIGISTDIPPMFHSGRDQYPDPKKKKYFINICDDQYKPLRKTLLDHGKKASRWIRKYFLDSPDVFVSSRDFLEERLKTWTEDPCDTKEKL